MTDDDVVAARRWFAEELRYNLHHADGRDRSRQSTTRAIASLGYRGPMQQAAGVLVGLLAAGAAAEAAVALGGAPRLPVTAS